MAATASSQTALTVFPRESAGSREARRLRRAGNVLGVIYGGGADPVSFVVSARELRHALADAGAVLNLTFDAGAPGSGPVVVKELVRHPVTSETMHIDLVRVRLDVKIQATVLLELTGSEDAPGVRSGGVLEHLVRELNVEALPTEIPDVLTHDVSAMDVNDTLTLDAITAPDGVELLDDLETVIATLTPPRLQVEASDEIEGETERVGDAPADADAADAGDSADASSDSE